MFEELIQCLILQHHFVICKLLLQYFELRYLKQYLLNLDQLMLLMYQMHN